MHLHVLTTGWRCCFIKSWNIYILILFEHIAENLKSISNSFLGVLVNVVALGVRVNDVMKHVLQTHLCMASHSRDA